MLGESAKSLGIKCRGKNVNIIHVYKDFYPPVFGGMERHIGLMCRYQRQWAEVEALVCSRSCWTRRVVRDGTLVTEVGEWGRFQSAPVSPLFPYYLSRMKADVVVVHMPNPTAEVSWLLGRSRGKLVVRYHSDVVRQARAMRLYAPLQMTFLRRAVMILPTSQPYLESSATLRPHRDRCHVVPLGILPESFASPDAGLLAAVRGRHGDGFVLFSGLHRYYKGLSVLVEAARAIKGRVVIAGEGPERAGLMARARALGVAVDFPGALSDAELVAYLHACAVFVFPSVERSEAFGISIMEAHACGKPVVATRLGTGVEYINQDGVTGLNVAPRDAGALAEAVNALLSDRARASAMGAVARERIVREFHAEKIARDEFAWYERALST
jgi:rhamnosyl/mannosyltransferase